MGQTLLDMFRQFKSWHQQLDRFVWFSPHRLTHDRFRLYLIASILLAGLCAAAMTASVRLAQYDKWSENPQIFALADGTPLYTTTDAPYFIGKAQALLEEGSFRAFDARRVYPFNRDEFAKDPPSDSLFDTELLVVLLAFLSDSADAKSLLQTGHFLIPITAALSAVMVMLAFGAGGYWFEGAIAGAGSGLCFANLVRTGAGRIDTDQLNVGLFYLLIAAVIWAARASGKRQVIILTLLACLCNQLFLWWYAKALFGWMAAAGLFWLSLYIHEQPKRSLIQFLTFILFSGIALSGLGIGETYFQDQLAGGELIFPNTFDTITEIAKRDWPALARAMTGSMALAVCGGIGYLLFCCRHPDVGAVYIPALLFIFASFIAGNRMIFFAAPVIWFGIGWLCVTGVRAAFSVWRHPASSCSASLLATAGCFMLVWTQSPTDLLQRPSFPAPVIQALTSPALQNQPDAVLASWWDYGYSGLLFSDANVFHDGGSQTLPRTHYIARGLLSSSPAELASILKFLQANGEQSVLLRNLDGVAVEQRIKGAEDIPLSAPLYLFLTRQMSQWMPSIGRLGAFDTTSGRAFEPPVVLGRQMHGYLSLRCRSAAQPNSLVCGGRRFDLNSGMIDNTERLSAVLQAEGGQLAWIKQFDETVTNPVLFIDNTENQSPQLSVLSPALFASNHHQMFHLGRFDPRYFELVEDNYPHSRLYRLK